MKFFLIASVCFFLLGCSFTTRLYLGSGFDNKKVTLIKIDKETNTYIIQDSLMTANEITGISYGKDINYNFSSDRKINIQCDSLSIVYEIDNKRPVLCDINYINSKPFIECHCMRKNKVFY